MGAELNGVGGDGEVAIRVNPRKRLIDEVDRDALRRGKRQRRRVELGMKAADRQHEIRVVSVGEQDAHRAGNRDEENMRVEQRRIEIEALLVELEHAGEVDLQDENGNLVGRQSRAQDAQNGRVTRRDLDDDAERKADQGRFSPSDLRHGADEERSILRREDGAQVTDDARRIGNHVLREHDALHGIGPDAIHQRLEQHGAIQSEQAADREQRETEAELDSGAEVGGEE